MGSNLQHAQEKFDLRNMNFGVLSLASFVLTTSAYSSYVRTSKYCRVLTCPPVIELECSGLCGSLYFYDNQNNTITTVMGSGKIESAVLKNWQGGKKIKGVKSVFAVQQVGQGCYRIFNYAGGSTGSFFTLDGNRKYR